MDAETLPKVTMADEDGIIPDPWPDIEPLHRRDE